MPRTLALALVAAVSLVAVAACDESQLVSVQNKTAQTLVVYEDGVATELVNPGATRDFDIKEFRGTLSYEVRYLCTEDTCDQTILAERTFTWEELTRTDGIAIVVE